jgi:hypothetical protein
MLYVEVIGHHLATARRAGGRLGPGAAAEITAKIEAPSLSRNPFPIVQLLASHYTL